MKYIIVLLLLIVYTTAYSQVNNTGLFEQLDETIAKKKYYEKLKESEINRLIRKLTSKSNPRDRYDVLNELYRAYFNFNYDSTMNIALEQLKMASRLDDPSMIAEAHFHIGLNLLASGIFSEARDTLTKVQVDKLNDSLKAEYYYVSSRLYFDMADNYKKDVYLSKFTEKGLAYLDSALSMTDSTRMKYYSLLGLKYVRLRDFPKASEAYRKLFNNFKPMERQFAIDASTFAFVLHNSGSPEEAIGWYIRAAIEDIRLANKDNVALLNLGNRLFELGDTDRSSKYINVAFEDATSFGAIQRKFQIMEIMPVVEAARFNMVEKQKTRIKLYATTVTVLSVLIIVVLFLLFRQLQNTKAARNELNKSNAALTRINSKLREVNLIKEEYIGYFFKTNSDLIDKLDTLRQKISNKLTLSKTGELTTLITPRDIRQEREALFSSFDAAFLNIFPDFIERFNALFNPEDQVVPNNSKQLNTDLRIFALIRLGITDTDRIAHILNYSVNTINTYKTRIKNLSLVANEEFEKEIMKIQSI